MERERTALKKRLQNTSCVAKLSTRRKTSNSSLSHFPQLLFDSKCSFYSQQQGNILISDNILNKYEKVEMLSDNLLLPQKIWIKLLNPIKSV